jgi:hypothetical protein
LIQAVVVVQNLPTLMATTRDRRERISQNLFLFNKKFKKVGIRDLKSTLHSGGEWKPFLETFD